MKHANRRTALLLLLPLAAGPGCERAEAPGSTHVSALTGGASGTSKANGTIYMPSPRSPEVAYGVVRRDDRGGVAGPDTGQYSLDFADTDVREAAAQILGSMLGVSYTIDPAVKGTVTMRTARPLTAAQLLPALQTLLGSAGAVLARSDGLFRVVPAATAGATGSMVVPLRYVSAEELAKVLQPLAGNNAKVVAEPGLNALVINGDPGQAQSLAELVKTFDTDALAGQSYAIMPVNAGSAKDFADAMTESVRGKAGSGLGGLLRVVPLARLNAVLVVSPEARYIDAARRVFNLIEQQRRGTVRGWHVHYLQNSNANDIAYILQMAFTPNNVTAQPQAAAQTTGGQGRAGGGLGGAGHTGGIGGGGGGMGGGGGGLSGGGGGLGGGGGGGGGLGGGALGGAISGSNPLAPNNAQGGAGGSRGVIGGGAAQAAVTANPLMGGLDQTAQDETGDSMRVLPNPQNNAVLVYSTQQEEESVAAMLRKIDIMPMQVRIDATIAEVTLNDSLQYGTQFFFKSGGINGILNNAAGALTSPASAVLGVNFPGFFLGGNGQGGAPIAISALQAVTTVNVLSSPQITVVDNQPARLQVGALVPYLTASSQSTLSANAPVINSIGYQPTGVIMEVTPRVNSGGLVTLDVSQEVSDVDTGTTTAGINSPTFQQRSVTSRVVVQDGQTIGLAGLIRDTTSRGNRGIPWLKDIPLLGALAGTQDNTRQRTELLVLITPHVIHDQADARAMTEDMRDALRNAAMVPLLTNSQRPSGSNDPNRRIREGVQTFMEEQTAPRRP